MKPMKPMKARTPKRDGNTAPRAADIIIMTWSASAKFWNIKVLSARMVNKGCFLPIPVIPFS